jgi:hypothetical protein
MTFGITNMRNSLYLLAIVLMFSSGSALEAAGSPASAPFFMFAAHVGANDPLRSVLDTYTTSNDYLSLTAVKENPELAARIGKAHTFAIPPSLSAVQQLATQCAVGLIIYDGEHWGATPANEQADMPGSVARGKASATAAGCDFGLAPDGQYAGLVPKTCDYNLSAALHRELDFTGIALYNIQAQRLLGAACAASGGDDNYVKFVTAVAAEIRARNPRTKVSAQLSFRDTPPDRMISIIGRLRGAVDGFYLAYPRNVGGVPCQYCTPENLRAVLAAMKSGS